MKNKSVYWISILSMILAFVLTGCSESQQNTVETKSKDERPSDIVQITPQAAQKNGIEITVVSTQAMSNEIKTIGEVKANENRLFHISSFVNGRVIKDNVALGDYIRQGQTLAVVQNLDVVKIQAGSIHELHANEVAIQQAKTRLNLAQKNLEREKKLLQEGISPRKDYLQAEADAAIARSELTGLQEHNTHIKAEARSLLAAYGMRFNPDSERLSSGSPVTAPRSGVVIKKNITLGEVVSPDQPLYEVADLAQVWLDLTIYPKDFPSIHEGQMVRFVSDSLPEKTFLGRVNYIQTGASETTQTFVARAYLANPGNILKPGMFGQAVIQQEARETLPFVPEESVQKYGKETFVFIPQGQGRYKKQVVVLGNQVAGGYLVKQGVQAGAQVVGKGSFTLKAEMVKSQFGEE